MRKCSSVRGLPAGMTLIEMVVVLAILAGLAGLVVPAMSFLKAQADDAAGATACADVMTNLEAYRTAVGHYPVRMDSLLDADGALIGSLWQHAVVMGSGGTSTTVAGLPLYLETGTIPSSGTSYSQSIGHSFGTDASVVDHNTSATDPSDSGDISTLRDLTAGSKAAVVKADSALAQAIFPGGVPSNVTLVALGVGPNCSAVGTTLASAPRFGAMNADEYARFVAIYALYSNGTAAKLKGVLSPRGLTGDEMISSYKSAVAAQDE